ncbi:MAG TPA: YeeE/YedE thiosulfate transporter family protein [Gemmatimonadaceae bacterium]|nr:YeeE/YedE thiosulfate transporter family protein [Gemmatimonadaceae bacterium]
MQDPAAGSSGQTLGSATAPAVPTVRRAVAAPYTSPYLAGVGVGLVLLLSFVLMGRGLGASGAFSSVVAAAVETAAPQHAAGNAFYAQYAGDATANPLSDWLVFEIAGVVIGGLASGWLAGRLRWTTEHGPAITSRRRLAHAFAGGAAMGVGAKIARGCTSGLGLTGGATLSVGSWLFVLAAFAGAYAAAPFLRRAWRE